jgi:hypothetical protein
MSKYTKSTFCAGIKDANMIYVIMGDMNEKHYEPDILGKYSGIKRTGKYINKSHFKTYDWVSNEWKIELKTRNNDCAYYRTTIIGYNKVEEWVNDTSNKRYVFLFGFLDGLYEWELTQENFDEIGNFDAVRPANMEYIPNVDYSTFNPNKLHLYIPVNKLTKINDKGCLIPEELKFKSRRIK